jgi:hypothetical protein
MIYLRISLLLAVGFFLMEACAPSIEERTDEEKISALLFDLQLIKEVVSIYPYYHKDSISEILFSKFFTIHGIDSLELLTLFEELREDPDRLKSLNEKALEYGERLLQED